MVEADAKKPAQMLNLARSTKVLVACAGPYGRYGEASVKAACEGKCHYVDITGEVPWVSKMARTWCSSTHLLYHKKMTRTPTLEHR